MGENLFNHPDLDYDGQGKSKQEETYDSMYIIVYIFVALLFLLIGSLLYFFV